MLEDLNERLARSRERLARGEGARARRARVQQAREACAAEVQALEQRVAREAKDVAKLEGLSLAALFASVLGDKSQKLRKERRELLAAELKLGTARQELAELEGQADELDAQLRELERERRAYDALLDRKESWLRQHGGPQAEAIFALAEEEGELAAQLREIEEALRAGRRAEDCLNACQAALGKAQGWGTFDLLGGGVLSTMAKRSNMDRARAEAEAAQAALSRFGRELEDLSRSHAIDLQMGGFLGFADYFFDGLIVDWVVQSRIRKADGEVARAQGELPARPGDGGGARTRRLGPAEGRPGPAARAPVLDRHPLGERR